MQHNGRWPKVYTCQRTNAAGSRIHELIGLFDLHAEFTEHPILAALRALPPYGAPSAATILEWVGKYSKQTVAAFALNFISNEVLEVEQRRDVASVVSSVCESTRDARS